MRRFQSLPLFAIAIAMLSAWLAVSAAAADWPSFLGPKGNNNASDEQGLPSSFRASENVAWKLALPGAGSSSPIVIGDRIFLTCYSGYGLDQDKPGEQEDLKHHVLCVDAKAGKILWEKVIKAKLPEPTYRGFIALHGYASSTPVSDGKSLYVFFGRSGVRAYSLDGDDLWQASVGNATHGWGSANSPILVGDLIIVNASVESKAVVALKKSDGAKAWQVDDIRESWSTPAVLTTADGKQELVISMNGKVLAVDPANGTQLWHCEGVPDYVCPAVVVYKDVAYVTGGRKPYAMAIRGGGRGDVTATHRLWLITKTPKVPSPVFYQDRLYWVSDAGVLACLKPDKGEVVYEQRVPNLGRTYATLLAADGKLFIVGREKGTIVAAAGDEFKVLGRGELGDSSVFNASPVPAGNGRLLLRSDKNLWCVGK